jgi:hypothetical protein
MLNAPFDGEGQTTEDPVEGNVVPLRPDEPDVAERLPRPALAYVLCVFLAGLVSIAIFAPRLDTSDPAGFIVLGVLAVALGRSRIPIYGDTTVSIAVVGDFAIAFLFGPAGAAIGACSRRSPRTSAVARGTSACSASGRWSPSTSPWPR